MIRWLVERTGYTIVKGPRSAGDEAYDQDGLRSYHNHDFVDDPVFRRAYARGCKAAADYNWHWRVHIGLWAAQTASKLPGAFVELGVNRGFMSSAIMEYLDWDSRDKTFFLLDTFAGLDVRYVSDADRACGALEKNADALNRGLYVKGVQSVAANFSQWRNVWLVPGSVPDTLAQIDAREIAFMHIDMNCSPPEVAAVTALWDRLVPGAIVLLDDYAYSGYESQKHDMDAVTAARGVSIVSLPTGQGLFIKPPAPRWRTSGSNMASSARSNPSTDPGSSGE